MSDEMNQPTCASATKGAEYKCPFGNSHSCKWPAGHTSHHECKCGYQWENPLTDVREGIKLVAPDESPFDPQLDWLVLMMEEGRSKKGALYIPDTAKDAPQVGRVLAAGPGIFAMNDQGEAYCTSPMMYKVGDRLLFAKYAGADVEWTDDKTYLFVKASDIICKVK